MLFKYEVSTSNYCLCAITPANAMQYTEDIAFDPAA